MSNELAKSPKYALSPEVLKLYEQDTGTGVAQAPAGGGSPIPSLIVLQAQSPQVRDGLATMADVSRLFNTATKQITDSETICIVDILPVWIEERPDGGGRVGILPGANRGEGNPEIIEARRKTPAPNGRIYGKVRLKNGNVAVEVFHVFALRLLESGSYAAFEPIVLKVKGNSLASLTAISNRLKNVAVGGRRLDSCNFSIRVTGKMTKNPRGQSFAVFEFEPSVNDDLAMSLIPAIVDGAENPVRVQGRVFAEKLREHGDELLAVMSNPPKTRSESEDEEDPSAGSSIR